MKILVVDDDFVSLNVMTSAVEKLGHQCISAEDGARGWELFQKEPCEVVLSDWMMPGMSGLDLCRLVRGFRSEEYCYFIMLSSLDKRHHVLEGLKAGADDYLTKPLDLEDLEGRLLSAARVTSLHRRFLQAQSQAVLNSKLAAVGQLAAGVAHQLNTPLGAVKLALDSALRRVHDAVGVEKKIRMSLSAIQNMQDIVSQLLGSSQMSPARESSCDMSRLVEDTLALLKPQFTKNRIEVTTRLTPDLEVAVSPSEFQQILTNLLTNARDAVLSPHSRERLIEVSTLKGQDAALLRVVDHGPGVHEQFQERLFEPFFTTKPPGSGVGLGLPIIKNLVEVRGGAVRLVVEQQGLTVFEVELPLRGTENSPC